MSDPMAQMMDAVFPALLAVAMRTQVVDGEVYFCRLCLVAGPAEAHSPTCEYAALRTVSRAYFSAQTKEEK